MAEKKISVNGKVMTFSTITEANNFILANEKNLIVTDEKTGIQSIDTKQQSRIEKKYVGIEFHRIISTFKSYQNDIRSGKKEKSIENIDKKTGIFQYVLESRKIAAMKTAKKSDSTKKEEKTENAAIPETSKIETKLLKVTSKKSEKEIAEILKDSEFDTFCKTMEDFEAEHQAKTEKKLPKVTGKKSGKKDSAKKENDISNDEIIQSLLSKNAENPDFLKIADIPENDEAMIAAMKDIETETTI